MEHNILRVYGHITRADAKRAVYGLLVEVFDKDLIFADRLGSVYTSRDGSFAIAFGKRAGETTISVQFGQSE